MNDTITTLTSRGPLLTKHWTAAGIQPYDKAANFTVEEYQLEGIKDLARVLAVKGEQPRVCAIRGKHIDYSAHIETTRDLKHFTEVPHHWVMLDVDSFEPMLYDAVYEPAQAVREFITSKLPAEFHNATHYWHLSSSAGAPGKEHILKAHIWFWFTELWRGAELEDWARALDLPVDKTVFRTVQVHYTAAPVIDNGIRCPVELRSGLTTGTTDTVDLVFDEAWVTARASSKGGGSAGVDGNMVDPRLKPGAIGAFCRAYPPERVIAELLPTHFEFQDGSDVRVTWLGGGGSAGGACITRDGLGLFNGHNTDPLNGHKTNMWDLVRHYMWGHLDAGLTDFELDDLRLCPSQKAMHEYVRTLPDVLAELYEALLDPETAPVPAPQAQDDAHKHEKALQRALDLVVATKDKASLDSLVERIKNVPDWTIMDRAQLAEAVKRHVKALTGAAVPISVVRGWLRPPPGSSGAVGAGSFPDVNKDGKVLATHRNLAVLLERLGIEVRYNVISKEDEVFIAGEQKTMHNGASASIGAILSECNAVEMNINLGVLKAFLTMLGDDNQYSPILDWVRSAPWDGVDRMAEWCATVESPNGYVKEMIMHRWGLQCIAIWHNKGKTQARGVMTFSGKQYAGKSRWVRSLAPTGLVLTGHLLDVHNKDSVKTALSYAITELGELDGTMRKSDQAAFKAWASLENDQQRRPYAVTDSMYPRMTGLCATVNEARYMQDQTGNTRLWGVDVTSINPDHNVNMQQVWAQFLQMWEGGEQHWMTDEEMTLLNTSNEKFEVLVPLEQELRSRMDFDADRNTFQEVTADSVFEYLGRQKSSKADWAELGRVAKRITGIESRHTNKGQLLRLPAFGKLKTGFGSFELDE